MTPRADRRHRRTIALWCLAIGNVAYAAYRAQYLHSCDLVHGYLEPTRAVVFAGADPTIDFTFISFAPFFYVVMAPLTLLPNWAASLVWSLISLGALWGMLWFLERMKGPRETLASPLVPFLCAAPLVSDNLNLGQSNLFALFFVAAALHALSHGKQLRAGGFLSVAIAWKLTPALLVVMLVGQRKWRALLGVALGLIVCFGAVPALAFGPERAEGMTSRWSARVVAPFISGEKGQTTNIDWYHTNQSMEAALQRSLTPYGIEHYGGLHRLTDLAWLTEAQAHRLATALRLLLLVALALAAARATPRTAPMVGALFVMGALFISPASWFSHYVGAVVAYAVIWREREEAMLTSALVVAGVFTWLSLGTYMRSHSLVFISHAWLFAVLYRHAWRHETLRRRSRTRPLATYERTAAACESRLGNADDVVPPRSGCGADGPFARVSRPAGRC